MSELVSTNWVYKNLNNRKLVILDCSWYLPGEKKNPKEEYKKGHIKNAFFFDIDKIANTETKLPHMIPNFKMFEKKIGSFGICQDSTIVTYDTRGIFSSPRVWWMFKYFGHKKIFVLNGGLRKWLKEKKPVTKRKTPKKKSTFKSKVISKWLINKNQIMDSLQNSNSLIIDARNNDRFEGKIKEHRKELRSGHIPGSKNLFWGDLVTNNGTLISKRNLVIKFNNLKIKNKKIFTSCGSGITSCLLSLSLLHGLKIFSSVYDGSWAEWGKIKKLPIIK